MLAAIDLTMADLYPPRSEAITNNGQDKHIAATYPYRDESGALLFEVVRFEPKVFRPRRPDGKGDWIWNLRGVTQAPYRLPELLAADPVAWVLIVDGEKDADRLVGMGFIATTNAGGAEKWRPEYSQHLHGRRAAIIPDNDLTGGRHTVQVAQSLDGIARMVRIVHLPGLEPKGDASASAVEGLDGDGPARLPVDLTTEAHAALAEAATRRHDWIGEAGRPNRTVVRGDYQRVADFRTSATDLDASLMRYRGGGLDLGYHDHYVVDGGKARVVLAALVTPAEVRENQPMLDLL